MWLGGGDGYGVGGSDACEEAAKIAEQGGVTLVGVGVLVRLISCEFYGRRIKKEDGEEEVGGSGSWWSSRREKNKKKGERERWVLVVLD